MTVSRTNNRDTISGQYPSMTAPDPVDTLLQYMRSDFRGITGSAYNFCRVLCEVTEGMLERTDARKVEYGWYKLGGQKKDILKFRDNAVYEVVYELNGEIALHSIEQQDYLRLRTYLNLHPLSMLITKFEIVKEYKAVLDIYKKKQMEERQRVEAEKKRLEQEDSIESVLKRIESAKSGDTIFPIRGLKNIHALIDRGWVPGMCDNPDQWVDSEEFASLFYKNAQNNEQILLIGREKLQAITEHDRIEYKFAVAKSKDKPKDFPFKAARFNRTKPGEPLRNWEKEFYQGLDTLTTYPEELRNKTVADLDVMACAIDDVIDARSQIDEGVLPVDALFKKETKIVLVAVLTAKRPLFEVRKTLDYFEHTGMVKPSYKDSLFELIKMGTAGIVLYDHLSKKDQEKTLEFVQKMPRRDAFDIRKILEGIEIKEVSENQAFKDHIYANGAIGSSDIHKKRVKVIVTLLLKSIPGEINAENITIAMQPYIEELGLDELDRIKQRILELKAVVAAQQGQK